MLNGKSIVAVVPCFNEERQIRSVIETMPDLVDCIIVVDDASADGTVEVLAGLGARRIPPDDISGHSLFERKRTGDTATERPLLLVSHDRNQGVGAAIGTGYKWCRDNGADVAVVLAGDGQMAPSDLHSIVQPVASDEVDYAKGNRLFTGEAWREIPHIRYLGNAVLSLFTKIASGYWHVADSQSGYTAIGRRALSLIDWDKMYKRYGQPNDLLVRLNVYDLRVRDVPIRPVYNVGEKSGIRIWKVLFTLSFLLLRLFFWRMKEKYIIRDFHPLVFFYLLSMGLFSMAVPLGARLAYMTIQNGHMPKVNLLALMFCGIMGLQSLFFAMLFDMQSNRELR